MYVCGVPYKTIKEECKNAPYTFLTECPPIHKLIKI